MDGVFALGRMTFMRILEAIDDKWQEVAVSVLVVVASTSFTLAVLAFRALLRVTIGTRSTARWTGPVVTTLTGCLGGMDGSSGSRGRN